jgi:hypothetical protein
MFAQLQEMVRWIGEQIGRVVAGIVFWIGLLFSLIQMMTELVFNVIELIGSWATSLLSAMGQVLSISTDSWDSYVGQNAWVGQLVASFFPVEVLILCMGILFSAILGAFVIRLVAYVYRLIPFKLT